ncbi:hypothetical protein ACIQF6_23255 [Kitasatospora sp. NPDC092948]|uniref:hypothetical protein n=1 Tax=Kitasatospora sp. NPDC092948 TaxID=3364088 RepID=UPI0037F9D558
MNRRTAAAALPLALGAFALLTACGSTASTGGTPTLAAAVPATASPSGPAPGSTPAVPGPVEDAAQALGEQGRGEFGDVYGSLYVHHDHVTLYATDPARARGLVEAAHRAHPDTVGVNVEIVACRYTAKAEARASEQIFAAQRQQPFSYPVYSSGSSSDGTGVLVTTSEEGAASQAFAQEVQRAAGSVPVRMGVGSPISDAAPLVAAAGTSG